MDRLSRRRWLGAAAAAAASVAAGSGTASGQDSSVGLDSDGVLVRNGSRVFPLGLYQLPKTPNAHREAREAGFSFVHCAGATAEQKTRELDLAARHGLSGWVTAGAEPSNIRDTVARLQGHPALLFWETEDEPSFQWKKPGPRVSPEKIRSAYALLKQLDPKRPVYLNHSPTNLVSTLQAYNPGGDLIATDVYPVIPHGIREQYALWPDGRQGDLLNCQISQVGQYVDKMREVAGPNRATWMVLQAFSWEMLRKENDRDPKMVLYPTLGQLRFMAWQAIVHGATGLLWWGLSFTPSTASLWSDLRTVAREIHSLEPALVSRSAARPDIRIEYRDTGHSLDRGIEWIAKREAGGTTLFAAVNADPNPVEAVLRGIAFESAVLGPRPGAGAPLVLQLPPFGVAVWRVRA